MQSNVHYRNFHTRKTMNRKIKYILVSLLVSVFVVACSDDADFSSDPSLRLEFSGDTISFDTLFTEIGSPTASFTVFNRNGSSLRVNSVALGGGDSSPFRVNVDGQYGNDIRDVEIRKNDSIFVFVNVALDRNDRDIPFEVRDSLVFTLESGHRQWVQLVAYGQDATVLRAPLFDSDTTLAAGAYIIHDSLTVADGCRLALSEGCSLYFHSGAWMNVRGSLSALGSKGRPVVFRGDRTDNLFDYLPYDRVPGQWGGITFQPTSNGNILDHCDLHSANYGLRMLSGDTTVQRLTVTNSSICNFSGNAFECENARVDVGNTLIANAGGNCVKVVGGSVRFVHCTIANFYVWTQRETALALHNMLEGSVAPLREALFANCVISGSKNDEIMGYLYELGDTIPDGANYRFVSSLLNTRPAADDDENFVNIVWDDKEITPFGKEHFALVDNSIYKYDFHLDSLSSARGIADGAYSALFSVDLDGVARPVENGDAGCFQYVEVESGKVKTEM